MSDVNPFDSLYQRILVPIGKQTHPSITTYPRRTLGASIHIYLGNLWDLQPLTSTRSVGRIWSPQLHTVVKLNG